MERYSAYKATGVEWMPEVPLNWEVKRLKLAAIINPSRDSVKLDSCSEEVVFLAMESVGEDGSFRQDTFRNLVDVLSGYTYFERDDVLLAKITPCFENGKATILSALKTPVGFGSTEFHVIRSKQGFTIPSFLFYTVKSELFLRLGEGSMIGSAGQKRVPTDFLADFPLPIPPLEEQLTIARFLDDKTAQIDQLITQKQQMLALLGEERAALINRAVTRGLDSDAPVRDSGIEWLGEVPAHWEVKRLKYFCQINPAKGRAEIGLDEIVTFLPMEKVSEEGEVDTSMSKTFQEVQTGYTYFEVGDTLVAKITPCFENGKGAFLKSLPTQVGFGSTEFHVLRASSRIIGEFLYLLTKTDIFMKMGEASMVGSAGQKRVPTSFLENFPVAAPPIHEQEEILAELGNRAQKYAETFSTINQEIALLKEYRAAIIAEAVTGQIDVRNYEPALSLTAESVG